METETLTLEVLRGIQTTLTGVREDLAGANMRLERLERTTDTRLGALERVTEELVRHQIATRESIEPLPCVAVADPFGVDTRVTRSSGVWAPRSP